MPHDRFTPLAALLAALLLLGGSAWAELRPNPDTTRHMRVYLDDREVGRHEFRFTSLNDGLEVISSASFDVRFAFITLFSYEHRARETWRNGCLQRLESETDEDGDEHAVSGSLENGTLQLETLGGERRIDHDCPWSFAYWTPALLERELLVNPQDGRAFHSEFESMGSQTLEVGGKDQKAQAWELQTRALDDDQGDGESDTTAPLRLTVYYDDDGQWLGLDSALENGRTLRYRPARNDPLYP